ncbi:hypothetical protein M9Y10_008069 [Tritrichomonas musculus]|uniref:Uncharacterized protein n=1 Tax=Tritrichomonas musculus TaxID=1915356 RepID=A0ABR2IXA2_9EUKA
MFIFEEKKIQFQVTKIKERSFFGCFSLKCIDIPPSVTLINESALEDCSSLVIIKNPLSVTKIQECSFSNCSSLTEIQISSTIEDDI